MRSNPKNVRYADLHQVCEHYQGTAKPYLVRQVLTAIEKKEAN